MNIQDLMVESDHLRKLADKLEAIAKQIVTDDGAKPNTLTPKQRNRIMYQLQVNKLIQKLKPRVEAKADYTQADCEKWLEDNLDISTASIIIKLFDDNQPDAAWGQLTHLGLC